MVRRIESTRGIVWLERRQQLRLKSQGAMIAMELEETMKDLGLMNMKCDSEKKF